MAAAFPLTNEDFAALSAFPDQMLNQGWTTRFDPTAVARAEAHGLVETRRVSKTDLARLTRQGRDAITDWLHRPALPAGTALTPRQRAALLFIDGYIRGYGYAPTSREIAAAMRWKSLGSVIRILNDLEQRGAITRVSGRARSIVLTAPPRQADVQ